MAKGAGISHRWQSTTENRPDGTRSRRVKCYHTPRGSLRGVVDSHVPAQQEKSELLRILSSSATAAWQLSPAMSRVSWLASLGDSLRRFRDRTHWHPLFCPAVPDTPLACMLGTTHSVLEHAARLARHHRQCPTGSPLVVVWPSTRRLRKTGMARRWPVDFRHGLGRLGDRWASSPTV